MHAGEYAALALSAPAEHVDHQIAVAVNQRRWYDNQATLTRTPRTFTVHTQGRRNGIAIARSGAPVVPVSRSGKPMNANSAIPSSASRSKSTTSMIGAPAVASMYEWTGIHVSGSEAGNGSNATVSVPAAVISTSSQR